MLFGTDVGYMTDYDPTEEYALLGQAGLSFPDVLAALTTAPAKRLSREVGVGLVAVGSPGDLVVLDDDPARDIRALARVRYTLRGGRIITRAASDRYRAALLICPRSSPVGKVLVWTFTQANPLLIARTNAAMSPAARFWPASACTLAAPRRCRAVRGRPRCRDC